MLESVIWYHLYNLKNVKNTHGGVLILVKLQAKSRNARKCQPESFFLMIMFQLIGQTLIIFIFALHFYMVI